MRIRVQMWLWVPVFVAACGDGNQTPDAAINADAPIDARYGGSEYCVPGPVTASCSGGQSTVSQNHVPLNPMYICTKQPTVTMATCTSGCSLTAAFTYVTLTNFDQAPLAQQLCAETVDATAGESCASGCVPTRAVLAGDGTVLSKAYLRCQNMQCTATTAPTIVNYLQACDTTTLVQYGVTDVNGLVVKDVLNDASACLLAWDTGASAVTSGITKKCIGDWQCPDGSLCDDQMTVLGSTSTPVAVCKPGPRGTLTPGMLSP